MKQIFIAVVLMMFAGMASAAGYGIVGGVVIKPDGVASVVIPFDGQELFLSEADCNIQREAYLMAKVKYAGSSMAGQMPAYNTWYDKQVTKIDATKCIKVTP